MERFDRTQTGILIVMMLLLLLMVGLSSNRMIGLGLAILIIAAFIVFLKIGKHRHRLDCNRQITGQQLSYLRTLNHYRHDWMNDLQVFYGYISMKRYEALPVILDQLKDKMTAESAIAKLGLPALVLFLLSFRTYVSSYELQVKVQNELNLSDLSINHEKLTEWVMQLAQDIRVTAAADSTNLVELTFGFEQQLFSATWILMGVYAADLERRVSVLQQDVDKYRGKLTWMDISGAEQAATIVLTIPCSKQAIHS